MVALHRGQLLGSHGAVECFEKAWDGDEEHLNPMAYSALYKINLFLDNQQQANHWRELFLEVGGEKSVASEWLVAIDECLYAMGGLPPSYAEE